NAIPHFQNTGGGVAATEDGDDGVELGRRHLAGDGSEVGDGGVVEGHGIRVREWSS
ncbi:hypothetical protein U1Q18_024176, partial [Sarracenia purpurea var. burkii]